MASPRRCRTTSLDAFRGARVPRTLLMIMALLLESARGQQQCEDTCMTSWGYIDSWLINDGWCDDGGPGAGSGICDLSTDCSDCMGPTDRIDGSPPLTTPLAL